MPGANDIKLLTMLQVTATAGKPIPGVKLIKMGGGFSNGMQVADVKMVSPTTKVCVRPLYDDWESRAKQIDWINGDHHAQGVAFAQEYVSRFANGDNLLADYHQIICEPPDADGAKWASFWNGVLDAVTGKIKVAVGCFSVFHPPLPGETDQGKVRPFDQFWKTIEVLAFLNRVQRDGNILLLDEYIWPDPGGSWTDKNSILRHQQVYDLLPQGLKSLPLWLGEQGTAFANKTSEADYIAGLTAWDAAVRNDKYLVVGPGWTDGGGGGWGDSLLDSKLDARQRYLLAYK